MIIGPNLGLGHNSMILMMEAQFAYVLDAIQRLRARGLRFADVRVEEQARYNRWVQARLARTVWNTGGCRSWYLTRSGRNTTAWPGFTFEFLAKTRRFDARRYELAPEAEDPARAPGRATARATSAVLEKTGGRRKVHDAEEKAAREAARAAQAWLRGKGARGATAAARRVKGGWWVRLELPAAEVERVMKR